MIAGRAPPIAPSGRWSTPRSVKPSDKKLIASSIGRSSRQLAEARAVIDRQHLAGDEVGAVDEPAHHLGDVLGEGGLADGRDLRHLGDALVEALLAEEVL